MPHQIIREAVGVFDTDEQLQAAIDELETTLFARHDISVLGDIRAMKNAIGKQYENPKRLEDNPDVPRGVHVAPEEKSLAIGVFIGAGILIGVVATIPFYNPAGDNLATMVLGGVVGALAGFGIAYVFQKTANTRLRKQIRKGGLPLWVRTNTPQKEQVASTILIRHGAHDVHIHNVPVTIQ